MVVYKLLHQKTKLMNKKYSFQLVYNNVDCYECELDVIITS